MRATRVVGTGKLPIVLQLVDGVDRRPVTASVTRTSDLAGAGRVRETRGVGRLRRRFPGLRNPAQRHDICYATGGRSRLRRWRRYEN